MNHLRLVELEDSFHRDLATAGNQAIKEPRSKDPSHNIIETTTLEVVEMEIKKYLVPFPFEFRMSVT